MGCCVMQKKEAYSPLSYQRAKRIVLSKVKPLTHQKIFTIQNGLKQEEGIIMARISLEMPENPVSFAMPSKEEDQLERNAMILYPYIRKGIISHGKAAEILGIFKRI